MWLGGCHSPSQGRENERPGQLRVDSPPVDADINADIGAHTHMHTALGPCDTGSMPALCSRALQDGGQLWLEWGAAGSADEGLGHVSSAMVAGDCPPGGQLCGSQPGLCQVGCLAHSQKCIC